MAYNYPRPTTASVTTAQAAADAAQADATASLVRVVSVPYTSALTPSAGWELSADGVFMAADSGRLFVTTVVDAAPAGWDAVVNAAKLTDGPNVAGGALSMTHTGAASSLPSTCPLVVDTVQFQAGMVVTAFISCQDFSVTNHRVALIVAHATNQDIYVRVQANQDAGPAYSLKFRGATTLSASITLADVTGGVWVRIVVNGEHNATCYYKLGGAASDNPDRLRGWLLLGSVETNGADLTSTVRVGLTTDTAGATLAAVTPQMQSLSIRYPVPPVEGAWSAEPRSTSAMPQTLPEVDLGAAAAVYGDTEARAYAARAGNTRAQDGGTLEWRVARGSTGLSGSGSWYAAGAIEVQGTGRYMLIEVRGTSDGLTEYSIRLDIPIAGV